MGKQAFWKLFVYVSVLEGGWVGCWVCMGVGCPCPPVRNDIVTSSLGFKEKDSAFLEQSLKICKRGQFFVLNKIRRGTRLIF